jgi:ABC-type multidrug transport system fused ATPase/permease subunit
MAVSQIGRIWAPIMAMAKAATASSELFKTMDAENSDTSGLKAPDVQPQADIVFENVSFAYPSRADVQILHNLSTTFEAGKVTAIVGPSGSGKSTIVGLIERWYDVGTPHSDPPSRAEGETPAEKAELLTSGASYLGAIKIGNINLNNIDAKWWRSQIGLVQQEPFLFNDTIFKNVAYGLCGTEWQDIEDREKLEMVKTACKEAYADEFISRLPKGYDTIVGESGIKLSGGQRQRIAIARSIVKRPPILILDEATSSIDVRTERIVQHALDRVAQNRTTIVIAHRLSTIKKADKIVVLRQGEAVEEGTHEELLQDEDGVYHSLVNAQALTMGKEELHDDDPIGAELIAVPSNRSKTAEADVVIPSGPLAEPDEPTYKRKFYFTSFGRLIYEQRTHWILYCVVIIGALGAGVVYPLQAYIFAKLINTFTLTGQALVNSGNHWALMFFIQAIGVGIAYFILGWSSTLASIVVSTYYRKEYLEHIIDKRIAFFDAEGNSAGTLTSRLSDECVRKRYRP